ncbi:hypothetical protein TEA_024784 [Camellia sinensis var. sinensis]|uniref:Small acidic protein-like domain-containing protein n=1 Tax=Camellia sinensis var. sinensis TaxID=542762 RepID=A0A4S4CYL0_CAMSN|nr:hypothetical protein TEA_024784 [Camellia sinensis var. sinensis]
MEHLGRNQCKLWKLTELARDFRFENEVEKVNRNLIGTGYMSTDQKKKLLWGNKKSTTAEEFGHHWDTALFSDRERQEKFNKLMGVKGELKVEHKPDNQESSGLQAEKQKELQLDLKNTLLDSVKEVANCWIRLTTSYSRPEPSDAVITP